MLWMSIHDIVLNGYVTEKKLSRLYGLCCSCLSDAHAHALFGNAEIRLTEQKLLSLVLSLSVEHLSANLSLSYFREEEKREYYKKKVMTKNKRTMELR